MNRDKAADEAGFLVDTLAAHLDGQPADIAGAALAELVATLIVGHPPELRSQARELIINCFDDLVPILIEEMIAGGRVPPYWREPRH